MYRKLEYYLIRELKARSVHNRDVLFICRWKFVYYFSKLQFINLIILFIYICMLKFYTTIIFFFSLAEKWDWKMCMKSRLIHYVIKKDSQYSFFTYIYIYIFNSRWSMTIQKFIIFFKHEFYNLLLNNFSIKYKKLNKFRHSKNKIVEN